MIDKLPNVVCNRGMTHLERDRELLKSLGGPTKVAELLGLPKYHGVQRVQNWMQRGIPASVRVERPDLFMPDLVPAHTQKQAISA